jgi:hypothetical protein
MEFLVKNNTGLDRWENGYYYKIFTFNELLEQFYNDGDIQDEELGVNELDIMMDSVLNLEIGETCEHHFFMNESYIFKRIK